MLQFAQTSMAAREASRSIDSVANSFFDAFAPRLRALDLHTRAQYLLYAPIIVPPSMGVIPNAAVYKRRESAYRLSVNRDYEEWVAGSFHDRLQMYAAGLVSGLMSLDESVMASADRRAILEAVGSVRSDLDDELANASRS